jgi:formyl-CoA transferase
MEKAEFFADRLSDCPGPLGGVRVLEATTSWAGPMASCVLGDLGADVIKVELPEGELGRRLPPNLPGTELSFVNETVNRNKRSLTLDLHNDAGRAVFLDLVDTVDIVVENFRAGTLDGWDLGYAACREVKPDIIYVSVTGWGQYGPASGRAAYDPAAQAYSGWMSLNGSVDGPPVTAPTWIGDDLAGLHGALGALAALRHRSETGEGQHVDVALLDAILFQSNGFPTLAAMGYPLDRLGSEAGQAVPVNSFACTDGHLYLAIALDTHWAILCGVIGRSELTDAPGFATNVERVENRVAVNAVVADWCVGRTRGEAIDTLVGAGLTVAPVNTFSDIAVDPHVIEREAFQPTTLEDGTIAPLVSPPVKFGRTPTRIRSAASALGEHNNEVLAELGYSEEQIISLQRAGAF